MIHELTEPFTWEKYSKRVRQKIAAPRNFGSFTTTDIGERPLRLVQSSAGAFQRGAQIKLHALVDPEDGILVDAKYELMGPSILVAALEACIEIIVGKNYDQAKRTSQIILDHHLRDRSDEPAMPPEAGPYLQLIFEALEILASQCSDIALATDHITSPLPEHLLQEGGGIPDWPERPEAEKLAIVRQVIERDVLPYVQMDAGGVEALRLEHGHHVIISYSGACDGCFSSTGATLSSIQAILQAKIHPSIEVVPEL